jgi:hypothetical protein
MKPLTLQKLGIQCISNICSKELLLGPRTRVIEAYELLKVQEFLNPLKVGEISYGFASQKFRAAQLLRLTMGRLRNLDQTNSDQFPVSWWSGRDRGSKGWFIYPTLKAKLQPDLIARSGKIAFDKIMKEW